MAKTKDTADAATTPEATAPATQVVTFSPKPIVVEVPVDEAAKRADLYAALARICSTRPRPGDFELVGIALPRYGDDGKLIGAEPPEPHLQAKALLAALFPERGHQ